MIKAADIHKAIANWANRYEDAKGVVYSAATLGDVKTGLLATGWKNVSRIDMYDIKRLGVMVVEAQYVGGARKTGKFVQVAVLREITPNK